MAAKAGTSDNKTKIEALHDAASRFVDLMRDKADATLLPFSSQVEQPGEFTTNKRLLKDRIRSLGRPAAPPSTTRPTRAFRQSSPANRRASATLSLTDGVDEDPAAGTRRTK